MPGFANEKEFNAASRVEASKGILTPRRRELRTATILYRFGNSSGSATYGCWWLEERQFDLVARWAAVNGLTLAHAVRVLGAVAHSYGDMRVLVRARVKAPLLAHEGRSRNQTVRHGGAIAEQLSPEQLRSGPRIDQLFIPGLRDPGINAVSLSRISTRTFGAGASHIGGVPGFPKGAKIQ